MAVLVDKGAYPDGDLVVVEFGALADASVVVDGFVGFGAFVEFLVAVAEDQECLRHGVLQISSQQIPFFEGDVLSLFDEHKFDGRHHGELFGIGDDGGHVHVAAVKDSTVEIAGLFGYDVILEIV